MKKNLQICHLIIDKPSINSGLTCQIDSVKTVLLPFTLSRFLYYFFVNPLYPMNLLDKIDFWALEKPSKGGLFITN